MMLYHCCTLLVHTYHELKHRKPVMFCGWVQSFSYLLIISSMSSAQPSSDGSEGDSDRGRHGAGVMAGAHRAQRGRDSLHHPVRLPEGVAGRTLADHPAGGWVAHQHGKISPFLYDINNLSTAVWLRLYQGLTPWLCWRSWSPGTSTWWRSPPPTRWATVRSPTPWSCCPSVAAHTATRTPGIPTLTWTPQVKHN